MVWQIEELCAELQSSAFAQLKCLRHGRVDRNQSGTDYGVATKVTLGVDRRKSEGPDVQVLIRPADYRIDSWNAVGSVVRRKARGVQIARPIEAQTHCERRA